MPSRGGSVSQRTLFVTIALDGIDDFRARSTAPSLNFDPDALSRSPYAPPARHSLHEVAK
jgi:hypothetical protein